MKLPDISRKNIILFLLLTAFLFFFFSYRLVETPNGINIDEASYGYTGILLSETFRDASGRFLPVFMLGSDNVTWYPPYVQYGVAILFKLFGPSVFMMRFVSVIITVVSALLTLYLGRLLFKGRIAFTPLIAFLIIPEVMIETHTPLEHMIMVPFLLVWMISLFKYKQSFENKFLVLAAFSLGVGFYSYAGIRPFVAVWSVTSFVYIVYLNWPKGKLSLKKVINNNFITPLLIFAVTLLPFYAMIPVFEHYYAGAVLNRVSFKINSLYNFFYYYLASFDPSFLFVMGDKLPIQSTLRHGMFLLSTLPIFAVGLYQTFKRDDYFRMLGITFFTTPLLLGFVGTIHIAHRLMYMIPLYCIFIALGVKEVVENRNLLIRYLSFALFILVLINYFDFWRYYMYDYPKDTYHIFFHLEDFEKPYKALFDESKARDLKPYFSERVARADGININSSELFARALYFPILPETVGEDVVLPSNAILLSDKLEIEGLKKLDVASGSFNLFTTE